MQRDHREDPGERQPERGADDRPAGRVDQSQARPKGEKAARALGEGGARGSEQRSTHDRADEAREGEPR